MSCDVEAWNLLIDMRVCNYSQENIKFQRRILISPPAAKILQISFNWSFVFINFLILFNKINFNLFLSTEIIVQIRVVCKLLSQNSLSVIKTELCDVAVTEIWRRFFVELLFANLFEFLYLGPFTMELTTVPPWIFDALFPITL